MLETEKLRERKLEEKEIKLLLELLLLSQVYAIYKGGGLFIGKVTSSLKNPNYNMILTLTCLMWASTHNTYVITLLLG